MLSALLAQTACLSAQSGIQDLLRQIERHNPSLQADRSYWEARRRQMKTGLTPYDPVVQYDYMFGSPAGAGNQKDLVVTQRFDFPTVYKRKRNLSDLQLAQTNMRHLGYRQELLLAAQLLALEAVYANRRKAELQGRWQRTSRLDSALKRKVERGEATTLEQNRTRLQLLTIGNEIGLLEIRKAAIITRLTEMNGGLAAAIEDTAYPALPPLPPFDELDSLIEANDPVIRSYRQEQEIRRSEVDLQKAMNLPRLESGYHSQGILGQSYRGFRVGFSLPLWENKNRLKAAMAELDYARDGLKAHLIEHRMTNKEHYDRVVALKKIMEDHLALFQNIHGTELLDKSIALGNINIVQYFTEQSLYDSAIDELHKAELAYHQSQARLCKYRL